MFVNTYQQYLSSNTRCRDNTTTISEITTSICVSVWSHTLYPWYNIHCIDDMAPTVFMAHYTLYMTSHHDLWHHNPIHYISLLYLISNWLYLTAHPLYLCHHTQIIGHITPIVYMITQAQYVWHQINTYDITSTLFLTSLPLYTTWLTLYLWHHSHCNYDKTPTMILTLYSVYKTSYKHCIHDIRSPLYNITCTLLDITPLYVWHRVHCIWPHVHCICVITPTHWWHHSHYMDGVKSSLSVTSYPLYLWHNIH